MGDAPSKSPGRFARSSLALKAPGSAAQPIAGDVSTAGGRLAVCVDDSTESVPIAGVVSTEGAGQSSPGRRMRSIRRPGFASFVHKP